MNATDTTDLQLVLEQLEQLAGQLEQLRSELAPIIELFGNLQRAAQAGGGPMAMMAALQGR